MQQGGSVGVCQWSGENTPIEILKLLNPKGYHALYLSQNDNLYELQSVKLRRHGSLFIDQRVSSSNKIHLATKIDPRFLILPYLQKSGTRFCPMDQIIVVEAGEHRVPLKHMQHWKLDEMCDVKDLGEDLILFRYNEDKTKQWLTSKVRKIAAVLRKQKLEREKKNSTTRATGFHLASNTFVAEATTTASTDPSSGIDDTSGEDLAKEDIKSAMDVIFEYVSDDLAAKLMPEFGFTAEDFKSSKQSTTAVKRKADWEEALEIEKETMAYTSGAPKAASAGGGGFGGSSNSKAVAPPSKAAKQALQV